MLGNSSWSKSTFEYKSFDLERPALRQLRLKGARDSEEDIECEIIQAYLDTQDVPDYEAISYTWGDTTSSHKILLDGFDFFVPLNLFSVLGDVRRQYVDRILWVDAICINQDSVRERGHQVQQMRDIYRRAHRVIFWLGPLTDSSTVRLMDSLADLQKQTRGASWSLDDAKWQNHWRRPTSGIS